MTTYKTDIVCFDFILCFVFNIKSQMKPKTCIKGRLYLVRLGNQEIQFVRFSI